MSNLYFESISYLVYLDKVFVSISDELKCLLTDAMLVKYGSRNKCNLNKHNLPYSSFAGAFKKYSAGFNLQKLISFCIDFGVSKNTLYENIAGFYMWGSHNKPVKIPLFLKIDSNFVEGYSLYVAEGDTGDSGDKRSRKVRFTNSNIDLIYFFMSWLSTYFSEITYYGLVFLPENYGGKINFPKWLDVKSGNYNKIPKYRICMDNALVIDLFHEIRNDLKKIVIKDEKLSSAYVKGIMAGEGTVYNNRSKYVRVEMKNEFEISFICKLLDVLKINYSVHERNNRKRMKSVYIGGRGNILRFYVVAGFGHHNERQEKLRKLVESY